VGFSWFAVLWVDRFPLKISKKVEYKNICSPDCVERAAYMAGSFPHLVYPQKKENTQKTLGPPPLVFNPG